MAAREYEEEQTQRTMLSLNTLEPSYPGKNKKEIEKIIQEVSVHDSCIHVTSSCVMYVYMYNYIHTCTCI